MTPDLVGTVTCTATQYAGIFIYFLGFTFSRVQIPRNYGTVCILISQCEMAQPEFIKYGSLYFLWQVTNYEGETHIILSQGCSLTGGDIYILYHSMPFLWLKRRQAWFALVQHLAENFIYLGWGSYNMESNGLFQLFPLYN